MASDITYLSSLTILKPQNSFFSIFYVPLRPLNNLLVETQGFSEIQSVIVSLIAEATASGNKASLADMADFVDCNGIQIMQYQSEIEELVDKGVLLRTYLYIILYQLFTC